MTIHPATSNPAILAPEERRNPPLTQSTFSQQCRAADPRQRPVRGNLTPSPRDEKHQRSCKGYIQHHPSQLPVVEIENSKATNAPPPPPVTNATVSRTLFYPNSLPPPFPSLSFPFPSFLPSFPSFPSFLSFLPPHEKIGHLEARHLIH